MGVIRRVRCTFSSVSANQRQRLVEILQREGCPLQEFLIGYSTLAVEGDCTAAEPEYLFQGWTIEQIIVPPTQFPACTQMRELRFTALGLKGGIPQALKHLKSLTVLVLSFNFLEGQFPDWLSDLPLTFFAAPGNCFSGTLDVFCRCEYLKELHVHRCCLEGEVPNGLAPRLAQMDVFKLGSFSEAECATWGKNVMANHKLMQSKAGYPNTRLRVTQEVKARICTLWEEHNHKQGSTRVLDKESPTIWPECVP